MVSSKCKHLDRKEVATELGAFYICQDCGVSFVSKPRKLANLWIAQRFYQSRGSVYTGQLRSLLNSVQAGGIIFLLVKAVWNVMPPLWLLPVFWLIQLAVETFIGRLDFKKWKVGQTEGLFGFQYSPLSVETLRRLKNIEKKVNPEEYREDSVVDSFVKEEK